VKTFQAGCRRAAYRRGAGEQLPGGEEVTGGRREGVPGGEKCGRRGRASRRGSRAIGGDEQRDLIGPGGEEAEELGRRVVPSGALSQAEEDERGALRL
jgi:hypothetical protein